MKRIVIMSFLFVVTITQGQEQKKFSLKQAINYAIKNSFTIKKANKDIEFAKNKKWETTATGLPQIDGTIDYKHWLKQQVMLLPGELRGLPGGFIPVTFGTKQTASASATLKQLIFSGSYLVGLQSAKTYMKISQQAKVKTKLSVREAVVNAYGNVLIAQESVKIIEKNKLNLEKTYQETKEIYKNGFIEQESVEQLEITLGMLDNNLKNARRMSEIAMKMLNISLGNKINVALELTDSLSTLTSSVSLNLLSKAYDVSSSIDYKMALNNNRVKELLLKLEKTKYLPTLSAFVNYTASANSNEFTFFDKDQKWFNSSIVGFRLDIPIFSSFGRSSKLSQAKINFEKNKIELSEIRQQLQLQLESARSEYQLSIENLSTAKRNLNLAERIENKNQIKFKEGIASSFDLNHAQNQLYAQQNNYIKSMLDVVVKKAKLERILNTPIK